MIAIYAIAKFLAYSAWCYVGLLVIQDGAASPGAAVRLGTLRWFIGLFFGVIVFFAVGMVNADATLRLYLLIYTPVRLVEWGIIAAIIARRVTWGATVPLSFWCLGGIVVSFLTDLLSPEGLQGRFCVGRCLC